MRAAQDNAKDTFVLLRNNPVFFGFTIKSACPSEDTFISTYNTLSEPEVDVVVGQTVTIRAGVDVQPGKLAEFIHVGSSHDYHDEMDATVLALVDSNLEPILDTDGEAVQTDQSKAVTDITDAVVRGKIYYRVQMDNVEGDVIYDLPQENIIALISEWSTALYGYQDQFDKKRATAHNVCRDYYAAKSAFKQAKRDFKTNCRRYMLCRRQGCPRKRAKELYDSVCTSYGVRRDAAREFCTQHRLTQDRLQQEPLTAGVFKRCPSEGYADDLDPMHDAREAYTLAAATADSEVDDTTITDLLVQFVKNEIKIKIQSKDRFAG